MSDRIDGGSAFPEQVVHSEAHGFMPASAIAGEEGLSKRDWFAAHESLAHVDNPENSGLSMELAESLAGRKRPEGRGMAFLLWEAEWRAAWKYIRADAMIAARSKPITGGKP